MVIRCNVKYDKAEAMLWMNIPHDQRLATATISRREDALQIGAVLPRRSLDVLPCIFFDIRSEKAIFRPKESHRQEYQIRREELFTAFHGLHVPSSRDGLCPLDAIDVDALDSFAFVIGDEFLGHDAVFARVFAHVGFHFGVAIINAVNARPLGPRVVASPFSRGLGQELKVCD